MGRAWVARHEMSTYKDTTPHIPFRTGPPSSKHKDGRPSRSVPSLFSCLCRPERHACYGPRDQEDSEVLACVAMYTTLFFGWRTEARTGSRHPSQLTITRAACYSTSCRSRCHVSQVRHQDYDRSPGTNAICRAASASPTSPMRSVAAPRVKLSSLIVSVDH